MLKTPFVSGLAIETNLNIINVSRLLKEGATDSELNPRVAQVFTHEDKLENAVSEPDREQPLITRCAVFAVAMVNFCSAYDVLPCEIGESPELIKEFNKMQVETEKGYIATQSDQGNSQYVTRFDTDLLIPPVDYLIENGYVTWRK